MEPESNPSRITFISHAATGASRAASFPLDEAVLPKEHERIASMSWAAPRSRYVLCGPEQRTRQTAEALNLSAEVAPELRDCDYGTWCGYDLEAIQQEDPEGLLEWLMDVDAAPHGGESFVELIERVGEWIVDQQDAGHIIAITHPAVIRAALVHALSAPPQAFWRIDIAPLTLTDLRFNGMAWTLRSAGSPLPLA